MPTLPKMPGPGSPITAIWNTVRDIVNYLPSLRVIADNTTTSVSRTAGGQVIHSLAKGTAGGGAATGGGGGGGAPAYEGPWKVEWDSAAQAVKVRDGYVIEGNSMSGFGYGNGTSFAGSIPASALSAGLNYIFLHCYVTGEGLAGTWHYELLAWNNQNYLTTQTGWTKGADYRHFCCTLAQVVFDAEAVAVTSLVQWQHGDVYISGRMV